MDFPENYPGITLEIDSNENSVLSSSMDVTLKVSGEINGVEKEATRTVSVGIDLIDAARIKEDFAKNFDTSTIKPFFNTPDEKLTASIKKAVSSAIEQMSLGQYAGENKAFRIVVEKPTTSVFDGVKEWTYNISIENTKTSDDKVTSIEKKFTASETETMTVADEALAYLQENLTEVTVPAGVNTSITGEANDEKLTTAVQTAIEKTFENSEYNSLGNKAASATIQMETTQMIANGKWKAEIVVSVDGSEPAIGYITLNLKNDAAQQDTVVKMELIDASSEVEVGTANLSEAVGGVKLYFEDSSKAPVVIKGDDLDANDYFTYDTTSWDTSKLGQKTVTFVTKSATTPVTVDYTYNVVSTVEYKNGSKESGNSAFDNSFLKVFGVAPQNVESFTSTNEDVIAVTFDKTTKNAKITAYGRGSATITTVGKAGRVFNVNVRVDEEGNFRVEAAVEQSAVRYLTGDNLGFEPHADNDTNTITIKDNKPTNWQDEDVVKAEIVTLGDAEVLALTPLAAGSATVVVKGGDTGKLENTIGVTVKKDASGALVIEPQLDYKPLDLELSLGKSAQKKIENLKVSAEDSLEVEDLGFTSSDKLGVKYTNSDNETIVDTIPAEDITSVDLIVKNGEAKGVTLKYYNNTPIEVDFAVSGKLTIKNTVNELGLVAESVKEIKNNPATDDLIADVEFTTDAKGNQILVITPEKDVEGTATITVLDSLDNAATIGVEVKDGKATLIEGETSPFKLTGDWELVVPEKKVYTIGDAIDLTGVYLKSEDATGKEIKISVTEDMFSQLEGEKFDTTSAQLDGTALKDVSAKVKYGQKDLDYIYNVKPASATVAISNLGLDSDEKAVSVANSGDPSISSSLNSAKDTVTIVANKISKNGAAVVTTDKGRSVAIRITVDSEGKITTSVAKEFESSIAVVENTEDVLGVVGTEASSANEDVAIVSVAGDKIIITSVAPGTTTITVEGEDAIATIPVTVDAFGTITIGNIVKANSNGWVRGEGSDWYYYIDGKKVTNDWVAVVEADPYNNNEVGKVWYHFDKDGKMQRGWIKDETGWKIYNLDSNGRMRHDMWINAEANEELGMPTGIYHLLSDGAAQMNGWAESITEGIYWFCAPNSGVFDASNPANWATEMPKSN